MLSPFADNGKTGRDFEPHDDSPARHGSLGEGRHPSANSRGATVAATGDKRKGADCDPQSSQPASTVSFVIPQTPKGKMRHQTVVTLRCGQCQRHIMGQRKECPHCLNKNLYFVTSNEFSPKEQKEYEKFSGLCALQGMRGRNKFAGPTKVECRFYFGIPESRKKKLKDGDFHLQRCDVDNALKSILDSCNGVVWDDDCTIAEISAVKLWTMGTPRTEVFISNLER